MAGEDFKLRQVLVQDESTINEYVNADGSLTWERALHVTDASVSLVQESVPDGGATSRQAQTRAGHKLGRTAELRITKYWAGHRTTTAGALTETEDQQLLGDGLGGNTVSQDGGTVASATDEDTFVTSGATFVAGGILVVGTPSDARGQGAAGVVSTFGAGTNVQLLNKLPATPASPDIVYAAMMAYHVEGASLISKRFCVMHAFTGAQFVLYGCKLAGLEFSTPVGGKATITYIYKACYWKRVARTFPDALAETAPECSPITGGSWWYNAIGTTTRDAASLLSVAEMTMRIDLGLSPVYGGSLPGEYQFISNWTRTGFATSVDLDIPWGTGPETFWDQENASATWGQLLFQNSTRDGARFGAYWPNLKRVGPRPGLPIQVNEQNYVRRSFVGDEGPDTTSDLTKSSVRLWAA